MRGLRLFQGGQDRGILGQGAWRGLPVFGFQRFGDNHADVRVRFGQRQIEADDAGVALTQNVHQLREPLSA